MPNIMRVPFTKFVNHLGETALRPMLDITLVGTVSMNLSALVDTGSDVSIPPYHVGLELGVEWNTLPDVSLSGNLAGFGARTIVVTGIIPPFQPLRLGFAWTRREDSPLLLGQFNFFQHFNAFFYQSKGYFEIQPNE